MRKVKAPAVEVKTPEKKVAFLSGKMFVLLFVVVLLLALGLAGYFFIKYQNISQREKVAGATTEVTKTIEAISKLIELPQGEQPTLATVSDKSKLEGQSFFTQAENGDKVLIYTNAKKAILYRPSTNKIVEVGPVNIEPPTPEATASISPSLGATVTPVVLEGRAIILNGTTTVGLTKTAETELTTSLKGLEITDRDNAKKNSYEKTTVSDISGKNTSLAQNIALILGGTVASLPSGESTPADVDIVIILGKDFTN